MKIVENLAWYARKYFLQNELLLQNMSGQNGWMDIVLSNPIKGCWFKSCLDYFYS